MLLQVAVAFALFGVLQGMKTSVDQSKGLEGSGEAPVRIDQLAKMAGMGVSTLHRHFHELTHCAYSRWSILVREVFVRGWLSYKWVAESGSAQRYRCSPP